MIGAKYLVSFIDNYSRRYWMYIIKKKSDVFQMFKEHNRWVELEFEKMIKFFRTNNSGDYIDDKFLIFCKQEDIKR